MNWMKSWPCCLSGLWTQTDRINWENHDLKDSDFQRRKFVESKCECSKYFESLKREIDWWRIKANGCKVIGNT